MKTHWRKADKTDFLGAADVEELLKDGQTDVVLTIKKVEVKEAKVRGKKGEFRIATFEESIKPMILNVTNAKVVKLFAGGSTFVDDWNDIKVSIFIQQGVKMGTEITEALRIRTVQPTLPILDPSHPKWIGAKKAITEGNATLEDVKKKYSISKDNETLLTDGKV